MKNALSLQDVLNELGTVEQPFPKTSFYKLVNQSSNPPKTFKIGRRVYMLKEDYLEWLVTMRDQQNINKQERSYSEIVKSIEQRNAVQK